MAVETEYNMNQKDEDFFTIIRCILVSRAKEGATLSEIQEDYYNYYGDEFPIVDNSIQYILNIPGVTCFINENGTYIFNVESTPKSQHVLNMVKNQKPLKSSYHVSEESKTNWNPSNIEYNNNKNMCYFNDNYEYLTNQNFFQQQHQYRYNNNKFHSNFAKDLGKLKNYRRINNFKNPQDNEAYLNGYQLIGDDFFLSLAKMELKCQFKRGHRILQSGLCVSGQTIADATRRIRQADIIEKSVIINIGSVDILHGHDLLEMEYDFLDLIDALKERGVVKPIITTLAPLANFGHRTEFKENLVLFNSFLREFPDTCIIDLWECMVNRSGQTLYECYQQEPRYVTGSNQPHVFWNIIGRQRILKLIKKQL